jgi:hypothetical protein
VGKSKHALWLELADMITAHPAEVAGMKVDAILRGGIRKFTDEVGGWLREARNVKPAFPADSRLW